VFDVLGSAFIVFGVLLVADVLGVAARFRSFGLRLTRWAHGNSPLGDFFERVSPPWMYRLAATGYLAVGIALIVTGPRHQQVSGRLRSRTFQGRLSAPRSARRQPPRCVPSGCRITPLIGISALLAQAGSHYAEAEGAIAGSFNAM
jgi:hypothetical protein